MTALRSHLSQGARAVFDAILSVLAWTSWLALAIVLGIQLWWFFARELAVPNFLLRSIEERLALSQLHVTFGSTAFDPSGRILVEDVKLFSPTFNEPLLTARSVYVRLEPWSILAGRFEPLEASASGISLFVPAMMSSSGRSEPLATNVEATLVPEERAVSLRQFTARIGTLDLTIHGDISISPKPPSANASLPVADFISRDYPRLSRRIADYLVYLQGLDQPHLDLHLTPLSSSGAMVNAVFSVKGVELTKPLSLQSSNVILRTRFPLVAAPITRANVAITADELRLPNGILVSDMQGMIRGTFQAAERKFTPEEADLSLRSARGFGFSATPLAVHAIPHGEAWNASFTTALGGAPVALTGDIRPKDTAANLHLDAQISPALLLPASRLAKRDLNELLQFSDNIQLSADVALASGWKVTSAQGRLLAGELNAHDVPLDFVSAQLRYAGNDFEATDVILRTRGNEARGSYVMDLSTHDYRFLLEGRLLPPDINGWFGSWWPNFFKDFDFQGPRPQANVDILGRWGDPRLSVQFVQVHAPSTAIHQVKFDDLRTTLFIRPGFYDALEVYGTQGPGFVRGNFLYTVTPGIGTMRTLDFVSTSTIDPMEGARIFGTEGTSILEPFRFASPPSLQLKGHLEGPASPNGRHETIDIVASSKGAFGLFDFPLSNVSFQAELRDDDLNVHDVKMNFAGGDVTGHSRMWGRGEKRRLSFDVSLANADLGKAVQLVEGYAAKRNQRPVPEQSTFEKPGVHLNLTADAEGSYDDLYSFQGKGEAELDGAVLGEIRLLGAMSDLFNFTALRFTNMTSSFKVNGSKLEFPNMRLTGANSSVTAHGSYALDRKELDFNAKLFPFGESKFIPQLIIGAVLSPLSQFLEVHLTGSLDKPSWEFVRGPRNFLRSLGGSPRATPPAPAPAPIRTNKELSPYIRRTLPPN